VSEATAGEGFLRVFYVTQLAMRSTSSTEIAALAALIPPSAAAAHTSVEGPSKRSWDDFISFGYDTPGLVGLYTTLVDATVICSRPMFECCRVEWMSSG